MPVYFKRIEISNGCFYYRRMQNSGIKYQKKENIMKLLTVAVFVSFLCTPVCGSAKVPTPQSDDVKIALAKKNQFVVKFLDVINQSGKKMKELIALESFRNDKKLFIFRNSKGNLQDFSVGDIKEIVFTRLRQGVLTGKPPSLRVVVWNGEEKNFELNYGDVKIKNGYLFLDQEVVSKNFGSLDMLKANSSEWSDKFRNFWTKKEKGSPEIYAKHFTYEVWSGFISRQMAAEYCSNCLKIEILSIQPDPEKETLLIRCQDVFYDRYWE
jgi:hypothetical protein